MGLRNVPVREVLGCWLERVVDGEGFIKVLTVRNLILSRRIHGSQKPGRGDVFGLDDAPTELWFWRFGIYKDAAPMADIYWGQINRLGSILGRGGQGFWII